MNKVRDDLLSDQLFVGMTPFSLVCGVVSDYLGMLEREKKIEPNPKLREAVRTATLLNFKVSETGFWIRCVDEKKQVIIFEKEFPREVRNR